MESEDKRGDRSKENYMLRNAKIKKGEKRRCKRCYCMMMNEEEKSEELSEEQRAEKRQEKSQEKGRRK